VFVRTDGAGRGLVERRATGSEHLLLVEGNPAADVRRLAQVRQVYVDGSFTYQY
jgi:hypothetical protein